MAGLWAYIQDQIGDLKAMVIDQIKEMVVGQVIKAGIQWLVGILGGPAGAFIKAVQAIISVVTWFMNNASRLASLINSIFSSIGAIAAGDTGGAANFIEKSLAGALPMVISFLADLLGLGGISKKVQGIIEKVQGIIEKVQAPIKKAIGWVVQKAVAVGKKLWGMAKGAGKGKGGQDGTQVRTQQFTERDQQAGLAAIDSAEQRYMKGGKISKQHADQVAGTVKSEHPVFQSLSVVDGGAKWNYNYIFRKQKEGEEKAEDVELKTDPAYPPNAKTDTKCKDKSHSNNVRIYCYDNDGNRWFYNENQGKWVKPRDENFVQEAERAGRAKLIEMEPELLSLIEDEKNSNVGGLDAAGIVEGDNGLATLHIGEIKSSSGSSAYYPHYVGPDQVGQTTKSGKKKKNEFSAITDNLISNIQTTAAGSDKGDQIVTAIENGNVKIHILLVGNAKVGKGTRVKLETRVRSILKEYLINTQQLTEDEVSTVIKNVTVTVTKVS